MLESQLRQQLSNVARRIGRLWMWQRLTWSWVAFSMLLLGWIIADQPMVPVSVWFIAAGFAATIVWIRSRLLDTPRADVARHIEQAFPDLNARLLAALEQAPDIETGRLNVLQRQVIAEAMHHAMINDWSATVPGRQMTRAVLGQTAALVSFLAIGLIAMQVSSKSAAAISRSHTNNVSDQNQIPVIVEPGNAELERGSTLLVLARFQNKPPAEVTAVWHGADGVEHQSSLTKSLDDPVFAVRLPAVKEDLTYRIQFDGRQTSDYRITVYDLPALVRSDLKLQFPGYTRLEPQILEDAFEATVVEGTVVNITCRVNKEIASAKLIAGDESVLSLQADPANSMSYQLQFTPTQRMRLKLELIDQAGRKNRDPDEFRIDVLPNRIPELTRTFPSKDVKVSPLEEVLIEGTTIDDFGIIEAGMVVQVAGRDPLTVPLGQDLKGSELHKFSSIQRLEDFRVQPDELITYYLYAIDFGPDGQPRQTCSDVFFAEVRPFDEIYRQIDQQSAIEIQSPQKPPDSLAKLIELQRQIIVSTWKLVRTANAIWSPKTTEELKTIHESQRQAIQKLQVIRESMTQPQLQPIVATVADAMENAQQELGRALGESSFGPLRPAVAAEQSSYQGLLKLRSKEHFLKQSKGNGSGQDNEEKPELELKRKENRYESEKGGMKKEESNINKEALAILDRLKELARRQEGINQQAKELEAQLRQAKTDAEREEFERQLKRLREEQQQLLHDADELRNKLNKSAQPEMVAETKNQLEQTRQRMVETAEKLREGQLSQALNAGTRAERELKQLHDDFRKQTAAQFGDAMRTLREEVRQLAERENQLAEQLSQMGDEARHTLRQSHERTQLQSEYQQQRQQMNDVVTKAKQVVEQAETSEPLLSKQLYDTLRTARESKLDQAMNATQQLLKQGILPEATKAEQQVRAGIDQLKQGIEKAAESVLGNEVDSLKRARRELAELSAELGREIQAQVAQSPSEKTSTNPQGSGKVGSGPTTGQVLDKGTASSAKPDSSGQSAGSTDQNTANGSGNQNANGPGRPNSAPTASGSDGGGGVSSDASAPTTAKEAENNRPSDRRTPAGLRSPKASGNSRPTAGREGGENETSSSSGSAGNSQGGGPLTGGSFTEFNERLRDVESMVSDPQLQAEVQKVRDRARNVRAEFKRHTNTPNWDLVRSSVHQPMLELQQRLADEIARRESPDSLVPVDRDPVPSRYRDLVRSYYERLGSGKEE